MTFHIFWTQIDEIVDMYIMSPINSMKTNTETNNTHLCTSHFLTHSQQHERFVIIQRRKIKFQMLKIELITHSSLYLMGVA